MTGSIFGFLLILLLLLDLCFDAKDRRPGSLRTISKIFLLFFLGANVAYFGFFVHDLYHPYNPYGQYYENTRTQLLGATNAAIGCACCLICFSWTRLASKIAKAGQIPNIVGGLLSLVCFVSLFAAFILSFFANDPQYYGSHKVQVDALIYALIYFGMSIWLIGMGIYFYALFRKIPEAESVNYKNITLVLIGIVMLTMILMALGFVVSSARDSPFLVLPFQTFFTMARYSLVFMGMIILSSHLYNLIFHCSYDPLVQEPGDYYKMEDEKEKSTHIAAGGTKHESAFWDEIDSKQ